MLKLIVDENIAFAEKAFNQFGNVILLSGREITNSTLKDADILIVRSITNVSKELLKNTGVKFVGTATIGTDHIDLEHLKVNNIYFADAKGCNAYSVAEYIVAALLNLAERFDFSLQGKSIGSVGVGNVGSKVTMFAEALGMKVLLNDPPLKRNGENKNFVELDEILKCDIITLHTPLNLNGVDKTYHLFDKSNLNKLKDGTILINSSRGAVVKNLDLINAIDKKNLKVVLDVWENEPNLNEDLLNEVLIATPHIAGYSYEGKVNGTKMVYESLCKYLNEEITFDFKLDAPPNSILHFEVENKIESAFNKLISKIYSIKNDDDKMKKSYIMNMQELIEYFDLQRKNYPIRREFDNYSIDSEKLSKGTKDTLEKLRFKLFI
jgi:erythronate-4-phosphate dehydrogenase